jgi:hypothetical protein
MSDEILYRGANPDLHHRTGGKLKPKLEGEPFERHVHYGEDAYYSGGPVFGKSDRNAAIMHETDSSKYPTAGVSTTPIYENAVQYATHGGKYESGYVYKIDATLLDAYGVTAYYVNQHAVKPQIPEDQEVILVARDFGELPDEIIIEVIKV